MGAGQYNQRVEIMRRLETDNGKGGFTSAWSVYKTMRAEVRGLTDRTAREEAIGSALQSVSTYRIEIRFRDDLLDSDQVRLRNGTDLNIRAIADPTGKRRATVILASTASAEATS